jgi:antitoxin component YwqK of YwqJK toxin-antitoxin module
MSERFKFHNQERIETIYQVIDLVHNQTSRRLARLGVMLWAKVNWGFLSTFHISIMVSRTVISIILFFCCSSIHGQYLSKSQLLELVFDDTTSLHKDTINIAKGEVAVLYIDSMGNTLIKQVFSKDGICKGVFSFDKTQNLHGFSFSLDSLENTKSFSFYSHHGGIHYEFYENHAIKEIWLKNHKKYPVLIESFYKNGNRYSIGLYEDTNPTIAHSKMYYEHGALFEEGILYNGQRAGVWKVYKRNGKLKRKVDYGNWTQLN